MSEVEKRRTNKGPFHLDLPFGEAVERFARTSPVQLKNKAIARESAAMPVLTWTKQLSTTDAQQPTTGGLVPYLRLTSGGRPGDWQQWIRNELFGDLDWQPGEFGRDTDVEIAFVSMSVRVSGVKLPDMTVMLTYGPSRSESGNDTPNTWLHWPDQLGSILRENDFSGGPVTITRSEDGKYKLDIQAAK